MLRRVLLERGSHATAAQLRINAKRLHVAFPERRSVMHHRRPAFIGADYLDQVAQEADALVTVKSTDHVRFLRGREAGSQVMILREHPGRQAEHFLEPCRPRLNLSHLHRKLGLGVIHPTIMPLVNLAMRGPASLAGHA